MDRKVGFTGTSAGARPEQLREVEEHLAKLREEGFDEFHHGLCIGADEQAARIASKLGYRVVAHPGLANDPTNLEYRSEFAQNDEVLEAKPFIDRDRDIVDVTEHIVATPRTRIDETPSLSGTWATVRYARKREKPVCLILPACTPPQ
jgi:hypothetical protein